MKLVFQIMNVDWAVAYNSGWNRQITTKKKKLKKRKKKKKKTKYKSPVG